MPIVPGNKSSADIHFTEHSTLLHIFIVSTLESLSKFSLCEAASLFMLLFTFK